MAKWGEIPTLVYKVEYTNWRGETSIRTFVFKHLWWGETEYHKEKQWLIRGFDLEKKAERDYAVKDMKMVYEDNE